MAAVRRAVAGGLSVVGVVALLAGFGLGGRETPPQHAASPAASALGVGALGRLEPKDGVRRVSGPSEMVLVLSQLLVDVGDPVKEGQVIARLDDYPAKQGMVARLESSLAAKQATIAKLRVTLANAELEARRAEELFAQGVSAPSQRDQARMQVDVARAELESEQAQLEVVKTDLRQARMDLERRNIRSPIDGQVLRVHTRAGEKVGSDGIVELGRTDAMYAVAEVYETDIAHVRVGQQARVRSAVLPRELTGTVERIARTVGKKRVFDDDPASRRDARVIEVEVRLDDSPAAAPFTNLQVEVRFVP
jgi:HlyD family secretion protein